jgi:hypothetical protein
MTTASVSARPSNAKVRRRMHESTFIGALLVNTEDTGHYERATNRISVLLASAPVVQTMGPCIDDAVERMGAAFRDRWFGCFPTTRVNGWIGVMLRGWLK